MLPVLALEISNIYFPVKVSTAWECFSLEQPRWFSSVALISNISDAGNSFLNNPCLSTSNHQKLQSVSPRSVSLLSRTNVLSLSFFWIFPKAQSNSVAYGICWCISSSSSSSPSWMGLAGSSCSDSALVSNNCSSRKKLPMPYSSSCAFASSGEIWGNPRTKSANLPDF